MTTMKTTIKTLLAALVVSSTFFSCTSEEDIPAGPVGHLKFVATTSMDNAAKTNVSGRQYTKLNEGNVVTFTSGDAISIFDGTANNQFSTSDAGTTATFSGDASTVDSYTALYPYQASATLEGTTLTATLPTQQKAQEALTYDPTAALSVATTTKEDMKLVFKNVTAMLKVTTTEPLKMIVLKGNKGEKLSGNVTINVSDTPTSVADVDSVALVPVSGESFPAGTYYINVATGGGAEFKFEDGFKFDCYAPDGFIFSRKVNKAVTLKRSVILNVGQLDWIECAKANGLLDANGHDFVYLGLPAVNGERMLWATMNIGANSPEEYGDYFAWGETEPYYSELNAVKDEANGKYNVNPTWKTTPKNYAQWGYDAGANGTGGVWQNYKYNGKNPNAGEDFGFTKYNTSDNKYVLDLEDDVARVKWGGNWKTPSTDELKQIDGRTMDQMFAGKSDKVNIEFTKEKGIYGFKITPKSDVYAFNNELFIPTAGYIQSTTLKNAGSEGQYWTSMLDHTQQDNAYNMYMCTEFFVIYMDGLEFMITTKRAYGLPVRPVMLVKSSR